MKTAKQHSNKLFLIFHGRYPSEKAASLFAAKSAEAFAGEGVAVTLVVPRRVRRLKVDHRAYYGLSRDFPVVYLPTIDFVPLGFFESIAFRVSLACFSFAAFIYLLLAAGKDDIIFSNEALPLRVAALRFRNLCFEMHDYPERSLALYRSLFRKAAHILVTNRWKLDRFRTRFPESAVKAFYEPNATSVEEFSTAPSREEARKKLGLPDGPSVVYTGHLYAWKGVNTLAAAAQQLVANVYVVGGTEKDVAGFKARWGHVPNLHVMGHRPHDEMPLWQKAANVVVLPNSGKEEISEHYTSPMKLFEYMASGTPIVASTLPSIEELAGDGRAILVEPDDADALAESIRKALSSGALEESRRALAWIQDHSWQKRAARILKALL